MPAQQSNLPECILNVISKFEKGPVEFAALQKSLGLLSMPDDFQFIIMDIEGCFSEAKYVKNMSSGRVNSIHFKFKEGYSLPLGDLYGAFGEFKFLVPNPSGIFNALAKYSTGNKKMEYAIIAENKGRIDKNSILQKISIRIDYLDE